MLRFNSVSYWYDVSESPVIYRCSIVLAPSEFLAVVGPSGGGKSTLLRLASGLLQRQHHHDVVVNDRLEGEITYNNQILDEPNDAFSYVPQNYAAGLWPSKTAIENIVLAVSGRRIAGNIEAHALALLDSTGIVDIAEVPIGKLSSGQLQRVAICRALITQPSVLFMDEPFANLDPVLKQDITSFLRGLRERLHVSILIVSHDVEGSLSLADRVFAVRPSYGIPEYSEWTSAECKYDRLLAWMGGEISHVG